MRYRFVAALLGGAAIVLRPVPAGAQVIDAGTLHRYNIAYRAVPPRPALGQRAKVTIPVPLGLIQALRDSAAWDTDQPYFNQARLVNYILNPPLHLEVKRAPTPTNDVEFSIARNQLIIDLGASSALVPEAFELGGSSRPFNVGYGVAGFRVGVMTWVHNELELRLDDSLRAVLKDAAPVLPNSRYGLTAAGLVQGGTAPEVSWGGRVVGDTAGGLYAGVALRYLLGAAYARVGGAAGLTTGDTIFSDVNPLTEDVAGRVLTADPALAAGTGVGVDLGVVWAAGPLEIGLGVTDIGATITWSKTTVDTLIWDADSNQVVDSTLARDVESKTVLPVTTILSGVYAFPTGTVVRGGVLRNNRGTILSLSGEQRLGVFALRAGFTRDQRDRIQYAWGGGVRLGPVGLDLGFFTHSRSLSEERSITMATTLSIY